MKTKINYLDPSKTALLIIDMQNDFIEKGEKLQVRGIRNSVGKLRGFIDYCRKKHILIIYTRHFYVKEKNSISMLLFPDIEKRGLKRGTKGSEISEELKPHESDIVINKSRYDAFFKTNLNEILESKQTKTIITGTMTQVCCESTARSAMFLNYAVIFCSDLTFCGNEN